MSSPIRSAVADAGPSVQTIFARRIARIQPRMRTQSMTQPSPRRRAAQISNTWQSAIGSEAVTPRGLRARVGETYTAAPMRRSLIAISACVGLAPACTVERDQPNLVGQDIHLTLIHTADIHSRLFPYTFVPNKFDQDYGLLPVNGPFGGIAKIAHVAKQIRSTSGRSLWLDSGDCFEGAPVFNEFKGEAEVRALSLAGVDAAVIGNHEFDLGAANLFYEMASWKQFPLLAANYKFFDPPNPDQHSLRDIVEPSQIFDVGGVKVGVIGLGNTSSLTSIYEQGYSLGFNPIDANEALQEQVRLLRPSVDVIVVLSHLGLDADENLSPSQVPDQNQ